MEIRDIKTEDFSVIFIEQENTIKFSGSLRLLNLKEYEPVKNLLNDVYEYLDSELKLDFSELKFLNSSGITAISTFVIAARKNQKLKIKVIGSSTVSWQEKSLQNLNKLWNEVTVEII